MCLLHNWKLLLVLSKLLLVQVKILWTRSNFYPPPPKKILFVVSCYLISRLASIPLWGYGPTEWYIRLFFPWVCQFWSNMDTKLFNVICKCCYGFEKSPWNLYEISSSVWYAQETEHFLKSVLIMKYFTRVWKYLIFTQFLFIYSEI